MEIQHLTWHQIAALAPELRPLFKQEDFAHW